MLDSSSEYQTSRHKFRQLGLRIPDSRLVKLDVPSSFDDDLTIDAVFVRSARDSDRLVVISSGVHGVEGSIGANVQHALLMRLADGRLNHGVNFLMIHGVNPFGFKYGRRVTENNVDLNRNFVVDPLEFEAENLTYRRLQHVLNPDRPVRDDWGEHMVLISALGSSMLRLGKKSLIKALAGGQYEFKRGIMFGGHDHEPNVQLVQNILQQFSPGHKSALVLDLHSGYGPVGSVQLMPNPNANYDLAWEQIFSGWSIGPQGGAEPYANNGDFSTYCAAWLARQQISAVPMLLEFGTLDSQKLAGSIASISRIVRENQNYWYGAADAEVGIAVRRRFKQMFRPTVDQAWERGILARTIPAIDGFVENFSRLWFFERHGS